MTVTIKSAATTKTKSSKASKTDSSPSGIAKKQLRIVLLADEKLTPKGQLEDFSEKQRELRKTEFDVKAALEALGHESPPLGYQTIFLLSVARATLISPMSYSISWRSSMGSGISISMW